MQRGIAMWSKKEYERNVIGCARALGIEVTVVKTGHIVYLKNRRRMYISDNASHEKLKRIYKDMMDGKYD
jgi:hypothetical protein